MAARYYVYALIDPRDGKPFYIGNGQRERDAAHEREATKGVAGPKCDQIRDIWRSGLSVRRERIAYFESEQDAYDFEETHIGLVGLRNLTNLAPGGGIACGERKKPHPWTHRVLKECSPVMARAAALLHLKQHLILMDQDVTETLKDFIKGAVRALGIDAVNAALKPHGVEIVG